MTKPDFAAELKQKQQAGNLKPSDFKRNRGWSLPSDNNSSDNSELTQLQTELKTLQAKFQQAQQTITDFRAEKNALELALFDKRLENLKQFTHYQTRIKNLEESELAELAKLRNKLAKHTFNLDLDNNTKLVLLLFTLALFLNLLK